MQTRRLVLALVFASLVACAAGKEDLRKGSSEGAAPTAAAAPGSDLPTGDSLTTKSFELSNPSCNNLYWNLTLTVPGGGGWDTQTSCDGAYRLSLQADGNLVLYKTASNSAVWATSTMTGRVLAMQADGNLVLYDVNNQAIWSTGTYGNPGAYLAVAGGALTVYNSTTTAPLWTSNAPYLACAGGVCQCNGIDARYPASAAINACILKTPPGWAMELAANNYVIDKQIVIDKPINFSTMGSRGSSSNCYTQMTFNNIPCAQLIAANNATFPRGGMFVVGKGSYPNFAPIFNVKVDHIVINGNYGNRYAAVPINAQEDYSTEWNFSFHSCTACGFTQGATFNSLRGEMAENVPYFQLTGNTFAYHGSNKELPIPRNAACFVLSYNSDHANIAFNYLFQCTDMGLGFDNVFNSNMAGTNIEGNWLVSRDQQYMTAGIHLNTAGTGNFAGVIVHGNIIDCLDPNRLKDAQCTDGIIVGGNPWAKQRGSPLVTGVGAAALNIYSNTISGSNIGVLVQFDHVDGSQLVLHTTSPSDPLHNTITVTKDNANGFFLPWSCKQWQGRNPGLVNCRATPGSYWYQAAAYPGTTISNGSAIVSSAYFLDPSDGAYTKSDSVNTPMPLSYLTIGEYWGSETGLAIP